MCASLNAWKDKGSVGEVWYILYSSSTMYYLCVVVVAVVLLVVVVAYHLNAL